MALTFNIAFDSSVNNAPSAFRTAIAAVAQFYEQNFSDPLTINIDVGYGEVNGQQLASGVLGESLTYLNSYSYSQIRSAFVADAGTADDRSVVANLPQSSPVNGTYWVATAEAKALGLMAASNQVDGYVGFSSSANFAYDNSHGIGANQYDFYGVVAHEFSEVMGRALLVGEMIGATPNGYSPLDLLHYAATDVHTFSGANPGYFSVDGGATHLADFNTNANGDYGDWASSMGADSYLAFSSPGVADGISNTDLRVLDAIGWDRGLATTTQSDAANFAVDVTGDHEPDLVRLADGNAYVAVSTGAGFGTWTQWAGGSTSSDTAVDVNGDGKADLVQYYNGHIEVALSTGSQFGGWSVWASGATATDRLVDLNGDGKVDLLQVYNNTVEVALSAGSSFGAWTVWGAGVAGNDHFADVNGDGKLDVVDLNSGVARVALSTGTSLSGWSTWAVGTTVSDRTVDLTGDGKADLLQFYNGTAEVAISTGSSFGAWTIWASGLTGSEQIADLNGDGKADLLQYYNGTAEVALSTGSGFAPWKVWASGVSPNVQTMDLNGDGKSDLLQFVNGHFQVALSTGQSFGAWADWTRTGPANSTSQVEPTGWASTLDAYFSHDGVSSLAHVPEPTDLEAPALSISHHNDFHLFV